MSDYQVRLTVTVQKKLDKLPDLISSKLINAIQQLSANPRPSGYKKLKGQDGYRIRVKDYRIIYLLKEYLLVVLVLDVGHRKDIYR